MTASEARPTLADPTVSEPTPGEPPVPEPPLAEPGGAPLAVTCRRVVHVYGAAGGEVAALRGVDLEVARGETVAVLGPSGAGKSTLLWLLAGLARPTAGEITVDGVQLGGLTPAQLRGLRADRVGIMLQTPARNLLGYATCLENVLFATRRNGPGGRHRHAARRAGELLETVGLARAAHARAGRLSGGEQQRLAMAVALANSPAVLLADEPTSQLDVASASAVIDLIRSTCAHSGTTVLVVTHDPAVAAAMGRTVTIQDGRIGQQTRAGRAVVVGADGQVHLPAEVLDVLPPGSMLAVERLADGVRLRRADAVSDADGDADGDGSAR
jgi:putative ABC transport system ATP-binding protein